MELLKCESLLINGTCFNFIICLPAFPLWSRIYIVADGEWYFDFSGRRPSLQSIIDGLLFESEMPYVSMGEASGCALDR